MKILLTNDDGYNAPGILALYEMLRLEHEVILIAPDREKSAVGHGITLNEPMRINRVNLNTEGFAYSVTGTPADCVKVGLFEFYSSSPPDLVISGINPGSNTGININYSGTVGAAREAALNGILSIAVSIFKRGEVMDFQGMSKFTTQIVNKVHDFKLPLGTFLNINAPGIPIDEVRKIRITRQASDNLSYNFEKKIDPRKKSYFWYGNMENFDSEIGSDVNALSQNFISITPIQCDMTDYKVMKELQSLKLSLNQINQKNTLAE